MTEQTDQQRALIRARNAINGVYSDLQWYVEQETEGKGERALELARLHAEQTLQQMTEAARLFRIYIAERVEA